MTYLGDIASDMPGRYMGRETYLEEQGGPGGHPHRHQGTHGGVQGYAFLRAGKDRNRTTYSLSIDQIYYTNPENFT